MLNRAMQARAALLTSLFSLLVLLHLTGCDRGAGLHTLNVSGETMGSFYNVKLAAPRSQLPDQTQVKALAEQVFDGIIASMSTYEPDSELSRLNRSESEDWQAVSKPLFEVVALSQEVSQASGGAFDITVAPLVNLWGFGPGERTRRAPSAEDIAAVKANTGFQKIHLDHEKRMLRKPTGLTMDLSAVAKGYAADLLADRLVEEGFANVMVEVGGELSLRGLSPRGEPWRIGIEMPNYKLFAAPQSPSQTVALTNMGMATSGDYRNYYEVDGVRFSHTIDPITGRPVDHALASVTVLARTCALADAWATALNVLAPERAMEIADRQGIMAYFIVRVGDGFETRSSAAFDDYTGGD